MRTVNSLIIGGGQAGLAMSRCLTDRSIDHVIIERGRVGQRWRSERWKSLRLLTPNWQTRLPGWRYQGDQPEGYMSMPELIAYLQGYADSFSAPIQEETSVLAVHRNEKGYRVATTQGQWQARNVVIATGHCDIPSVPQFAAGLSSKVQQIVPTRYRDPSQLAEGGVLVVGASASGVQLADELQSAGKQVTLSVGRHTRLPRRYRGQDIFYWLDAMGILKKPLASKDASERLRTEPSLQLVGRSDSSNVDLATLEAKGVRITGRAYAAQGNSVAFADDLEANLDLAERKLERTLGRIDSFIRSRGLQADARNYAPKQAHASFANTALDLHKAGIATVVWATGFRRSYPWLQVPVTGPSGELVHQGGVTASAGLYALGLAMMRRRNSTYIDGVGLDASELADHIQDRNTIMPRKLAA